MQKVLTFTECDMDQGDKRRPGETLTFWDSTGMQHEIDLCEEHQTDLQEVLTAVDDFAGLARRIGPRLGKTAPSKRGKASNNGRDTTPDPKAVRVWANEQGIEVSARGRISAEVVQQYLAAH